jgi:uroporphyrinogen-III synthase
MSGKPNVFISRTLTISSPLLTLTEELNIVGKSLLSFSPVPIKKTTDFDWIFFYSQQGVIHFFNSATFEITNKKLAAFGRKTGQVLKDRGITVAFTGDGSAENTARAFALVATGDRVLFARAKHSRKSLQELLADTVEVKDLIVYDNKPVSTFEIPYCDVLIFTSPLNATTFFKFQPLHNKQKIIAIGKTTRNALRELGIADIEVPAEPSESAIAALLKEHFAF